MREILFRGKRLDNGEWVYGSFCMDAFEQFNGLCGVDGFIRLYDKTKGKMQSHEVERETVSQYTGLKDKNGKRIFEGDIWNCKGYIGLIIWCNEESCFEAVYEIDGMQFANAVSDIRAKTVEVIGNVHDNPELLKKEDK